MQIRSGATRTLRSVMSDDVPQILVAEDNSAMANVLRFTLSRAGFEVTLARDGREAWEQANVSHFDLIVTDHQMPYLTGVELCRLLRKSDAYREAPILMLTAKRLELDCELIQSHLHVTDIIPKPFSPRHLIECIQRMLNNAAA